MDVNASRKAPVGQGLPEPFFCLPTGSSERRFGSSSVSGSAATRVKVPHSFPRLQRPTSTDEGEYDSLKLDYLVDLLGQCEISVGSAQPALSLLKRFKCICNFHLTHR